MSGSASDVIEARIASEKALCPTNGSGAVSVKSAKGHSEPLALPLKVIGTVR